jgi:hypothetical protein
MSRRHRVTRLGNLLPIGLLLEALCDFLKTWSSPEKWQLFGLLFVEANLFHFHLNKQFQNVVGILRFQKWFDVDVLGFQIELCCRYFDLFFDLKTVWATFWKIGQFFLFKTLLVTLRRQVDGIPITSRCFLPDGLNSFLGTELIRGRKTHCRSFARTWNNQIKLLNLLTHKKWKSF